MTDDQNTPHDPDFGGEEPPVPPLAGGAADPTLPGAPGGADPTLVQPATPGPTPGAAPGGYTTGPGYPPDPSGATGVGAGMGAAGGGGAYGGGAGGGVGGGGVGGGAGRPAWLLPAAGGLAVGLIVAIAAFLLLRDDGGDDTVASGDVETTIAEPTTTVATETTVDPAAGATETTVPPADTVPETTIDTGGGDTATTVDPGGTDAGTTDQGDTDGGDPNDPCSAGYVEVTALPFDLCAQGDVVTNAQSIMAQFTDITVDGFYGPTSYAKVQELQTAFGLEPTGIVDQALLDTLQGVVPPNDFKVATEGFVRIGDQEYPIIQTCRTIPFEGQTGSYSVISYAYASEVGVDVIDRWFDEGGASGVYFGETGPITELEFGFGFQLFEGDGSVLISVNPAGEPSDTCLGRVTQLTADGATQTRVHSIVDVCTFEDVTRVQISEDSDILITAEGDGTPSVTVSIGLLDDFFFATNPDVVGGVDPDRVQLSAEFTSGDDTRVFTVDYPADVVTPC
ncbi:MAG: peptidoglycan-binding domain-containing protein [Actinomycetota bacterium]